MKKHWLVSLVLLAGLLLALNGGIGAKAANARGTTAAQVVSLVDPTSKVYLPLVFKAPTPPIIKIGLVTDLGGVNDNSFNALAWKGVTDAVGQFGVQGKYLESSQRSDYARNIQQLLDENEDLIVTVGFSMGVDTANAARANPNARFAIVDYTYPDCWTGAVEGVDCGSFTALSNVRGMAFQTDQAGLLAGYLAAGMTKTGHVGTFGGLQIPSVTIFMKGYQAGVKYYNQKHGATVQELGWDDATQTGLFTGNFTSTADGISFATSLVQQGADIIMPVAGSVGLGSASYCQTSAQCLIIGVDTDWFVTANQYASVELSSVEKNVDLAVFKTIQDIFTDHFIGGTATYPVGAGVSLAPYHNFDSQVPQTLQDEINNAMDDLENGIITVDGILASK